jgi:hypothetical protein
MYASRMNIRILGFIVALTACRTEFVGDAHFPNGATGCRATCSRDGLDMIGFVYSGEYSSSCVCGVRGGPGADVSPAAAETATAAAAAQQRQQQNRQQQQSTM